MPETEVAGGEADAVLLPPPPTAKETSGPPPWKTGQPETLGAQRDKASPI